MNPPHARVRPTQSFRFDNDEAYSVYRLTFPTLPKNDTDAMQIADVRLFAAPKPATGITSTLTALALGKLNPTAAGDEGLAREAKQALERLARR